MTTNLRTAFLAAAVACAAAAFESPAARAQSVTYNPPPTITLPPIQQVPRTLDLSVNSVGTPTDPDVWTKRYPLTLLSGSTVFLDFYSPPPSPYIYLRATISEGAKKMMMKQLDAFRSQRSAFTSLVVKAAWRGQFASNTTWFSATGGTSIELAVASPILRNGGDTNEGGLVRAVFWEDAARLVPGTSYQTYGYATMRRLRSDGTTQDRDFYMLRSDPNGAYLTPTASKAESFANDTVFSRWLRFFMVENPMNTNGIRLVHQGSTWSPN